MRRALWSSWRTKRQWDTDENAYRDFVAHDGLYSLRRKNIERAAFVRSLLKYRIIVQKVTKMGIVYLLVFFPRPPQDE